jgi:hypothetical protein
MHNRIGNLKTVKKKEYDSQGAVTQLASVFLSHQEVLGSNLSFEPKKEYNIQILPTQIT